MDIRLWVGRVSLDAPRPILEGVRRYLRIVGCKILEITNSVIRCSRIGLKPPRPGKADRFENTARNLEFVTADPPARKELQRDVCLPCSREQWQIRNSGSC